MACGRFDAFWEYQLSPWDVAPGALLLQEAGGKLTAVDGGPFDIEAGTLAATNGPLHAPLLQALVSARAHPANSREGLAQLLPADAATKIRVPGE